jgi:hypothetical protein
MVLTSKPALAIQVNILDADKNSNMLGCPAVQKLQTPKQNPEPIHLQYFSDIRFCQIKF